MSKLAHIVAIRRASLETEGKLGFGISDHDWSIDHVLDEGQVWIAPRPVLEESPDFVQPIPYIVIRRGDEVLAYERGAGGGDARLHSKVAIGFGGHVDGTDAHYTGDGIIDLRKTMENACIRELEEELGISFTGTMPDLRSRLLNWSHIISADDTPVDRVHIGLVAQIDVSALPNIDPANFEDVIENARFVSADGLFTDSVAGVVELETWTRLILSLPSS